MSGGGTMLAFDVAGGKKAAFRMANALSIIGISNNLGDAKSLITHPETTTHQRLKPEQRAALGIGPGLLRLSVGLEDPDDLQAVDELGQDGSKLIQEFLLAHAGPRRKLVEDIAAERGAELVRSEWARLAARPMNLRADLRRRP